METIKEAKQYLRENWEEGVDCPCCTQMVKLYPRSITSAMAFGLIIIYKYFRDNPNEKWLHVENHFKSIPGLPSSIRGDISKLVEWSLLEHKDEKREDGSNRNGYYRITELGNMFVRGEASVSRCKHFFNNKVYRTDEEQFTIHDALRNKFSYYDLMK